MSHSAAHFDHLIVGAGAAGSVLARRLSEDAGSRILLIEAGADVTPGAEPADIRNVFPMSSFNRAYMWPDTRVHWRDAGRGAPSPLPQGRVVGGSSALMGMWALRGRPEDYDAWRDAGATGWGWDDVLPWFRHLEADADFDGPMHGKDGPIPIRRETRADWSPFAQAVSDALDRHGYAQIEDMNADFSDGHCVLPVSRSDAGRASAGLCYLNAAVRLRPNLTVLTDCAVDRLTTTDRRVTGVMARRANGTTEKFTARETHLAAGALRSPVLLMRSGIGPGADLARAGIDIVADRPGVGRNLQNHPVIYLASVLNRAGREAPGWRPAGSTYLRYSSGLPDCPPGDMAFYIRSYLSWHALGRRMASLAPLVTRPMSRGAISLGADGAPVTEFRLDGDPRDVARLVAALRFALTLYDTAELRAVGGPAWALLDASRLMQYNQLSRLNAVRARLAATALDLSARAEGALLSRSGHMRRADTLPEDDTGLTDFVAANVTGTGHICGTCTMGRADDPNAVTDPQGRVHGVEGLRVVDASIMPVVPSGNTHIPVVMTAEKLADAIRRPASTAPSPIRNQQTEGHCHV